MGAGERQAFVMQQAAFEFAMPYGAGWCEANKWKLDAWPQWIMDKAGKKWLVLHVGGVPYAHSQAVFCCYKPPTAETHVVRDVDAFPVEAQ